MNLEIFKMYDIRGTYPTEINESISYIIGKSYGSYIQEKYNQTACIVSHDNRLSSESLTNNLIKGITESGCNVINYGLTTTPMNYYGRYLNHLFGIMVTASHNPKDDNGFKFSFDHLSNARGEMIEDFKTYTVKGVFKTGLGKIENHDITTKYLEYMKMGINLGKKKIKVVIDCANGATTIIARKIFEQFNIDFEIINEENDGNFPNHHPDPIVKENLEQLKAKVLETHADLGVSYDGDGDRVGFIKNDGSILTTEEFMILIIRNMINNVTNKTFLYDVKCSKSLEEEIKKLGGTPYMHRTGASFTQAKTKELNLPFGGEYSSHFYFRDKVNDIGSGIYASLRLIEIMSYSPLKLTELTSDIPKYFITEEIKIHSENNKKFNVVNNIKDYCEKNKYPLNDIDGVKVFFKTGWALVRASNTGPNIIFRAEGNTLEDQNKLKSLFLSLLDIYNK